MPQRSRGLTLVEVLAATVLLSLLSVAAVGLVRDAREASHQDMGGPRIGDLSVLVDRVLVEPDEFGLAPGFMGTIEPGDMLEVLWPGDPALEPIRVTRLDAQDPEQGPPLRHAWILFEWEELAVVRFLPVEEEAP